MGRRYPPSEADLEALVHAYRRFMPLTPELEEALRRSHVGMFVDKGERCLTTGSRCDEIYFVASGLLHMYFEVDGKMSTLKFVSAGGLITDYGSFLRRTPSEVDLLALEQSTVLTMNYDTLHQLYESVPGADRLGRKVAESLFMVVSYRNESLISSTAEQRYIEILADQPDIINRVPLYLIATYLGVTPEALSRIRRRLTVKPGRTS